MATVEKITFRCYTDSGIYFYAKTDAPNNEWLWMDENSGGLVSSADELTYQGNYNMQLYKIISIDENSVYYNADFMGGGSNSTATRYSAGDLKTVEEVPEPDPQPQPGGGNLKMHTFFRKYDGEEFVTLIDTSTPGTYTIENPVDTIAEIAIVGAGGGGVGCAHGSKWYYADGGGGAAFVGTINISAGTYTVTVGAGGASNFNASSASDAGSVTGGDSSLGDLIIAGGGIRGSGTNCVYPGAGGTLTVNADVISADIQSNGNNATGGGMNGHGQAQSLYQDYGKGGMGIYGGSVAGTNGYVKVRIKVSKSKIKAYTIMRRFIKHAQGDYNPQNVLVIGSPTINEQGVVSGFSTANYIRPTAFKPESSPWEMMFKVTTGEDVTTEQCIFGVEDITNQRAGFGMSVHNGFFSIRLMTASSGTSWTFGGDGTIAVQPNTTYNLKAGWDGNTYSLQVMKEGASTYITDISYTSSSPIYRISNENEDTIGVMMRNSSTIYPFLGSIDLSESYMKVNGEYYWTGFYTSDVEGYKAYSIIKRRRF